MYSKIWERTNDTKGREKVVCGQVPVDVQRTLFLNDLFEKTEDLK
jgi:hypothetical protein